MKKQSFQNHIRFYPPHHFIYYPIVMTLIGFSIYFITTSEQKMIWTFISLIFVILFCLSFMLRQHYALTLQNRIVRLELRYRYFSLTAKRLENFEDRLSDEQLFALRFAPDEELVELVNQTLMKNLSSTDIKKSIVNWKGDYHRV